MAAEIPIDTVAQWQLLQSVCSVFESDLAWESRSLEGVHVAVVEDTAKFLKIHITEIKARVRPEEELSWSAHSNFIREINALLSTFETLVKDEVKLVSCENNILVKDMTEASLSKRCPKLLVLATLLQSSEQCAPEAFARHIHLVQDAAAFKEIRYELEGFIKAMQSILPLEEGPAKDTSAAQSSNKELKSRVNRSFWDYSKSLFDSIVKHLQPCTESTSSHRAMLHLRGLTDTNENDAHPELSMLLACCPEQKTWQQTFCTVSSEATTVDAATIDICQLAQSSYNSEQILKIQLSGDKFLDMSELVFGQEPEYLGANSTFSLDELLKLGVFKKLYGVYPNDKKILAYILAQALLCLYDGPWLQTLWTPDKVLFRYDAAAEKVYNIHQPYIPCVFLEQLPPMDSLDRKHRHPMILSFAKLLVDLQGGLDVVAQETDNTSNRSLLSKLIYYCDTWSDRLLSKGYANALRACVMFPKYFKEMQQKNSNVTVQEVILTQIVHQLEIDIDMERKHRWGLQDLDMKTRISIMDCDFESSKNTEVSTAAIPSMVPDRPLIPTESIQTPGSAGSTESKTQKIIKTTLSSKGSHLCKAKTSRELAATALSTTQGYKPYHSARAAQSSATRGFGLQKNTLSTATSRSSKLNQSSSGLGPTSTGSTSSSRSVTPTGPRPLRVPYQQNRLQLNPSGSFQTSTKYTKLLSSTVNEPANDTYGYQIEKSGFQEQTGPRHDNSTSFPTLSTIECSFGRCMFSIPTARKDVSTETFRHMNEVTTNYFQHFHSDKPVKVAVIDTGIDMDHDNFRQARTKEFKGEAGNIPDAAPHEEMQRKRILELQNFCPDQDKDDVNDLDGHGTQVAGIILRLAPNAELYVARVCAGDINNGLEANQLKSVSKSSFIAPEPDTVEKAIRWAIGKGVDIINLSLGYRKCDYSQFDNLVMALRDAQSSNIVVFAATSNQGAHDPIAWPAKDSELAIGIHSSIDSGRRPSDFTAIAELDHNFMVVGENILSQWPTSKGGGFRLCTGTSFASPVAAAVGALVLAFAFQKLCSRHREKANGKIRPLEELRTNSGMRKVLLKISTKTENYLWIRSKLFWHSYEDDDRTKALGHAWEIIENSLKL